MGLYTLHRIGSSMLSLGLLADGEPESLRECGTGYCSHVRAPPLTSHCQVFTRLLVLQDWHRVSMHAALVRSIGVDSPHDMSKLVTLSQLNLHSDAFNTLCALRPSTPLFPLLRHFHSQALPPNDLPALISLIGGASNRTILVNTYTNQNIRARQSIRAFISLLLDRCPKLELLA